MRAVICRVVHLSVLLLKSVLPPFHPRRQRATGKNGSFDALRLLRMTEEWGRPVLLHVILSAAKNPFSLLKNVESFDKIRR